MSGMSVVGNVSSPASAVADRRLTFLERLGARMEAVGTSLCVGLDPDPASLPAQFNPDAQGIEAFARLVIDMTSPYAAAFKANLAFYEAFGSAGIAALERIRAAIPADIPFVADAKRGDIASTVARQAVALFDVLGADAVTVNPYLGRDAIAPLIERDDRFAYVLCRTSNAGAAELQGLAVAGDPLYVVVARAVAGWSASGAQVGLVVGATAPSELRVIRQTAPALPILVPGVGAQGGDVAAVMAHGPARGQPADRARGGGLLVNVSRGISAAAAGAIDPGAALNAAARQWAAILQC
jgi:orotidine-5'-phosphate decarboxylase